MKPHFLSIRNALEGHLGIKSKIVTGPLQKLLKMDYILLA